MDDLQQHTLTCNSCGLSLPATAFSPKQRKCRRCRSVEQRNRRVANKIKHQRIPLDPNYEKTCAHPEHQGQPLLLANLSFARDATSPDGYQSACKACKNTNHTQNQAHTSRMNRIREHIIMCQQGNCFACFRPIRRPKSTRVVDDFYGRLLKAWIEWSDYRLERISAPKPPHDWAPEAVLGVVQTNPLTVLVRSKKQDEPITPEELEDYHAVCGKCWTKWLQMAGVDFKSDKKQPRVAIPEPDQKDIDYWEAGLTELQQTRTGHPGARERD